MFLGEHFPKMDSSGVFGRTKASEGIIRWTDITDIVETKDHLFLFVDANMSIVVPKRAVGSAASLAAFLTDAQSSWNTAKA